jgi:uncharacterized SAM-binding protein YcdF (DUF218 family)
VNQLFVLLGIESWKPFLGALLLPPVPLLAMMLLGARLILPRRGLGWLLVLLGAVLLWLSSTIGTGRVLAQMLLTPPAALTSARVAEIRAQVQARQPIAIVVLGGGMWPLAPEYGVSNLTETSIERLRYGLWLNRETGAPLAFSGGLGWGNPEGGMPEAQIAARIAAQEFGRPLKWVEDRSRDTRENAAYTVALLKAAGIDHIVLATHDYHIRRAVRAFEDAAQGTIRIDPAPLGTLNLSNQGVMAWMPSNDGFAAVRNVLHEALGKSLGA